MKQITVKTLIAVAVAAFAPIVTAEPAELTEVQYLFNTFFLLICGVLVMFMAAGFAMLEAGLVRSKSVAVILAKNISLYAIASLMFFLLGYQLMYGQSELELLGSFSPWRPTETAGADTTLGQPSIASWFFQMVFVATAASVVSGALAERVKFWAFALFVVVLTGALYPIVGHWTWGGGWLASLGFQDFAGSTVVHSLGGWSALAGIVLLGARRGRFDEDGRPRVIAPSSLPMVALGTFILWLGWFGFNGGSQLSFATANDAYAVATIFANTNAAAAGGVVATTLASQLVYRRLDLTVMLNGALAGLVSITAGPLGPSLGQAAVIGAVGGLLMMAATRALEHLLLDDAVGAIPVHLIAGIWGTVAVAITNPEAKLMVQLWGVTSIGAFTFFSSCLVFAILNRTLGIRLHRRHEREGGDLSETGMRAYNIGQEASS
ncbi:MAG: ammonium transporter [Pseudomonadota bacterium]